MLVIRLQRVGKKHQPSYRIVVAERRSKLGGPPTENLGSYNTFTKKADVKKERVEHWLKNGARASVTVHNLLVGAGVISGTKIPVKIRKPKAVEAAASPAKISEGNLGGQSPTPALAAEEKTTESVPQA